jgi:phosphoserine phosphatase
MATRLLLLDCDSTLSAVEGIDELGRLRGAEVFKQVERMTAEAMDGSIPLEKVFAQRLALIRPTRAELAEIAAKYIATIEPDATEALGRIRATGWQIAIVSGGFTEAILPLAIVLGIERVYAVELYFDTSGNYTGCRRYISRGRRGATGNMVASPWCGPGQGRARSRSGSRSV